MFYEKPHRIRFPFRGPSVLNLVWSRHRGTPEVVHHPCVSVSPFLLFACNTSAAVCESSHLIRKLSGQSRPANGRNRLQGNAQSSRERKCPLLFGCLFLFLGWTHHPGRAFFFFLSRRRRKNGTVCTSFKGLCFSYSAPIFLFINTHTRTHTQTHHICIHTLAWHLLDVFFIINYLVSG